MTVSEQRLARDLPCERDPVVEAYKKDIDRSLLRERLKRTPAERIADLVALARMADELRGAKAGRGTRP